VREESITLPARAGVETVSALRREMLSRMAPLQPGDSITLDFSALEKFDTSLGQLIMSLKKTACNKGITLEFRNVEPHKAINAMLNCDSLLETPAGGSA